MEFVITTIPKPSTTTLALGVSTVIAQALLIREAMASMGGSETAWGVVMALWLAGMGVGSRFGVRFGSPALARALPLATLALAGGGVLMFRAAPAILDAAPGEILTTWRAIWLWVLAVAPSAIAGGLAFPILAGDLARTTAPGDDRPPDIGGPGLAYTLEAAGALAGGVALSFVLLPAGSAAALLIAMGVVGGSALWHRSRVFAAIFMILSLAAAIPASDLLARATWRWAGHPGSLGRWDETRHQRIDSSAGIPSDLYANGRLAASYPDPWATLPRAHFRMLLHPAPRRVLAVGCTADGSVEAMVRHPVSRLLIVEEDPLLIRHLMRSYGDDFRTALTDPKVTILQADPLRAVDHSGGLDLVILADGNPTTMRANRTRTVEFLRRCRSAMTDDGILIMKVGVSDTYLGGTSGALLATLASTLREVFPSVTGVPGDSVLLIAATKEAGGTPSLEGLTDRRLDRPEIGDQLHPAMLPILIDHDRSPALDAFIEGAVAAPNTIAHPRAVRLANRLHETRSGQNRRPTAAIVETLGPRILSWGLTALVIGLLLTSLTGRGGRPAMAAAFVVGFASMGWWLLLLGVWQMTRGSVYAEVGALTGAFMAGVAAGGWVSHRSGRAVKALPWIMVAGAGLSALLATGVAVRAPILLVPALLASGGILTGAAFPGLGELAGRGSGRRGAGLAFAADEMGAAAAALVIGTVAIPWVGMTATSLGLAVLGLAAIPAALRA